MKPIDAKKLDEMLVGMETSPDNKQLEYQKMLLESLEGSTEFLKNIEAATSATITLVKQNQGQAFAALMSGMIGAFTLGVEAGQTCSSEEQGELQWPSEIEKVVN